MPNSKNLHIIKALNIVFIMLITSGNAESVFSSFFSSSEGSSKNDNQVIIVTPEMLFTIPHEGNIIRFECSKNNDVISWIFPNDAEIKIPINSTATIIDESFNVTRNYLEIISVKNGMDGRYACILKDNTKYNFFIPHIVSNGRITKSIMISLSVTGIFCILCLIILMVDKYCWTDIDDVKAQTLQKSLRTKNVSSATMTNLEFPA